jgi:hypothetical protein
MINSDEESETVVSSSVPSTEALYNLAVHVLWLDQQLVDMVNWLNQQCLYHVLPIGQVLHSKIIMTIYIAPSW